MHVGTTRCETIWHPKKIQSQVQIGIIVDKSGRDYSGNMETAHDLKTER